MSVNRQHWKSNSDYECSVIFSSQTKFMWEWRKKKKRNNVIYQKQMIYNKYKDTSTTYFIYGENLFNDSSEWGNFCSDKAYKKQK